MCHIGSEYSTVQKADKIPAVVDLPVGKKIINKQLSQCSFRKSLKKIKQKVEVIRA